MISHATVTLLLVLASVSASAVEESLLSSNRYFTGAIYREVAKSGNRNFLISPFSLETLLALLHSGASGETAEEIRIVLRNQTQIEAVVPQVNGLYTANKLYLKKRYKLKEKFRSDEVESIDFANRFKTTKTINQWVKKQTGDKINHLVVSNDLDSSTRAILISALYFNGSLPFKYAAKEEYHQNGAKVVTVDTLYSDGGRYNYTESEDLDAKFLELPFRDTEASMVVVLPNKKNGLADLEAKPDVFLPQGFKEQYVSVSLPRFKLETRVNLKPVLQNLGMRRAFTYGQADFSGITDTKLAISGAIQKTLISVGEAWSDAVPEIGADVESEPESKQFQADHPFIFYVEVKGLVILAGRVEEPTF